MFRRFHSSLVFYLCILATVVGPLPNQIPAQTETPSGSVFVTTAFGTSGALLRLPRIAPWKVQTVAMLHSTDATVQANGDIVYVVDSAIDQILMFHRDGDPVGTFNVGKGTRPRDIFVRSPELAYVTRANATHLYRVNPQTGVGANVVDLSIFADDDGIPEMERMIAVGTHLFVQLRRTSQSLGPEMNPNGALAVIDLVTETIVDADPSTPELDAIELFGPAPRLRMYVDPQHEFLLVSATDGFHLSLGGGVEKINLKTFSSEGFVLEELELAALGGFVVTDGNHGYFLFHTDIVASNHLIPFSVDQGAQLGPEIVVDLGMYLDSLLYDPVTKFLFVPSSTGGLYVVNTETNTVNPDNPTFAGVAVDQIILADILLGDVNMDGMVSLLDVEPFVRLLNGGQYQEAADVNVDGFVNLLDVEPFVAVLTAG